jgi:hypothetical protein
MSAWQEASLTKVDMLLPLPAAVEAVYDKAAGDRHG